MNYKSKYRICFCIRCKRRCTHHINKIICVYCEYYLEGDNNEKNFKRIL